MTRPLFECKYLFYTFADQEIYTRCLFPLPFSRSVWILPELFVISRINVLLIIFYFAERPPAINRAATGTTSGG